MAVFSTNQNRQLYVVTGAASAEKATVPTTPGEAKVITDGDKGVFAIYKGNGGAIRTDIIYPKSIMWATASAPDDTAIKLKSVLLELNEDDLVSGEDYVLRINFRQFYGMSDEDIYQKYGAVHCTKDMVNNKKEFFAELAYSLVKNFNRTYAKVLEFSFTGKPEDNIVRATKEGGEIKFYTETGTTEAAEKLYINEASQVDEWALGTKQLTRVNFEVIPTEVADEDGNLFTWGKLTDNTKDYGVTIGNGYNIADLEYFCMGERGDQYRNVGWPKSIPTKYLVDPTKTYFVLDIHYAYRGTCEDIQKSEKTITFVSESKANIDTLIKEFGLDEIVSKTKKYDGGSTEE